MPSFCKLWVWNSVRKQLNQSTMKLKLRWHMHKYAHVPSINNVCHQDSNSKYFLATIFRKYNFLLNCSYIMLFMKVESLHLIISDIITWCGLENSDIWDSSLMTESGCGWGHRMINCVNNIWLKSDDKLEKASIIISAASWFLTRLEIIKSYYTLILGTWYVYISERLYEWCI